jgi:hypothetical protein
VEKPEGNGALERSRRRRVGNIMSESWTNSMGWHGLDLLAQDKDKGRVLLRAVIKGLDSVKCRVFPN